MFNLKEFLIGEPLPSSRLSEEKLTKTKALAVFSTDALSSVAYATEEILRVLILAGVGALALGWPISLAIAALLTLLTISYRFTLAAYPNNGGAYVVARENFGLNWGLVAGISVLVDYTLVVAVGVSAGVTAITSVFPALLPFTVSLALLFIVIMAIINLRGIRESATVFAYPTYLFILSVLLTVGVGLFKLLSGTLPSALPSSEAVGGAATLSLFLILRAFSSGSTALTGVEAISNGITAFRPPAVQNARITLVVMSLTLGVMFLGISYLAIHMKLQPLEGETLLSQLGRLVYGGGPLWIVLQTSTALILFLSANTSFNAFPSLASLMARDGFLPRQFTHIGDRLVHTNGILVLSVLAGILVVAFGAVTTALILLFAIGVYSAFTFSQAGMVLLGMKERHAGWQVQVPVSALGAVVTLTVVLVFIVTKFTEGAWIILVLIPALMLIFQAIRRHYQSAARQMALENAPVHLGQNHIIVLVGGVGRGTFKALEFVRSMNGSLEALHVALEPERVPELQEVWHRSFPDLELTVLNSPYRQTRAPILGHIRQLKERLAPGDLISVVIPEFVPTHFWENLLHNQTALYLKAALLFDDRVATVSVPVRLN